ncbi:MAG: hypothetical protein RLO52_09810 [Sandaracinaceae bacterium]
MTKTMEDLFPGNMGRMLMIRVMLKMRRPDLRDMPRTAPLEASLVAELETTIRQVQLG